MQFVYTSDKDDIIVKHENEMFLNCLKIIDKYRHKFKQYKCSIQAGCGWTNSIDKTHLSSRLPYKNGYECYIYCTVERDGKTVRYRDKEGEVDYYELSTSWNISSISRCFLHLYVNLCTDLSDVIDEMDCLLEKAANL